jgi:IS5 family transposase
VHESRTAEVMLDGVEGDAVIADKAYDSNAIRDTVRAAGMKAVIPVEPKPQATHSARQGALPRAQPHRALLQQTEALSTPRYSL